MILWKLVSRDYTSLTVDNHCMLRYTVGEVTTAYPGSVGIFCYKTKRQALESFGKNFHSRVLRVSGESNRGRKRAWCYIFAKQGIRAPLDLTNEPGVVLCDSVCVIREIVK